MTKHSDNHGNGVTSSVKSGGESSISEGIHDILNNTSSEALSLAKTNWYFGEWEALADINIEVLGDHPDVGLLAALKATGYQQLNEMEKARQYIRAARELGCDQRIISRLLVAGVENTLGKIAALQNNEEKTIKHFEAAVDLGGKGQQAKLARHARSVKEITRLGLLPQASKLIQDESEIIKTSKFPPRENEARIAILDSELELINHELSLAHQKQQLYFSEQEAETIIGRNGETSSDALKKLSPSQLGQDLWVLEKTGYKRDGFFVEFGATDGVILSNTYLLEKSFGWKGICAEPNPIYQAALNSSRNCKISDACISGVTGDKVTFILANEYSGIKEYSTLDMHKAKREAYESEGHVIELNTISLDDFLKVNEAPQVIDYISIDTEGSEYEILENFPFDKWDITLFTIEHNFSSSAQDIKQLMMSNGYKCIEKDWDYWFYKRE